MAAKLGGEVWWLCPSISDSANDLSGNGYNATYQNGMGTTSDVSNGGTRAYLFDGVNDYLVSTGTPAIGTNPFSVAMWVFVSAFSAKYAIFDSLTIGGNGGRSTSFVLFIDVTTGRLKMFCGGEAYVSSGSLTANTWNHVVITRTSGTTINSYINGSSAGSGTVAVSNFSGTTNYSLGEFADVPNGGGGGYVNLPGRIDDARVFNKALSQSEITRLASKRGYQPAANNMQIGVAF